MNKNTASGAHTQDVQRSALPCVSDERLADMALRKDIACDDWPCLSDDVICALHELQRLRVLAQKENEDAVHRGES